MDGINPTPKKHGVDLHCKCGAYLGKIMPGYVKLVQCYCGEIIEVEKPSPEDLKEDADIDLASGLNKTA